MGNRQQEKTVSMVLPMKVFGKGVPSGTHLAITPKAFERAEGLVRAGVN
jgi:hypothetical protein